MDFALEKSDGSLASRHHGCPRWAPCDPYIVLHCTESNSASSTIRYFRGMRNRFAGYHAIVDVDGGIHWLAHPGRHCMYGSGVRRPGVGGNTGVQISIAYFARNWRRDSWREKDYRWWRVFNGVARVVVDAEEMLGFSIPRKYHGDPVGRSRCLGDAWKADSRKPGFWAHGDIDPRQRTDPAWSEKDWEIFFRVLDEA